jgi:hypothetical protein
MSTNVKEMSTADLVACYNRLTGKTIKKFSSREAGEKQVLAAISKQEDKEKAAATAKAADKKPEAAPKKKAEPSAKKSPTERAAAIGATWKDTKVRAARSQRTNVEVGGQVHRSVAAAFKTLKLPMGKMIAFRIALKASAGKLKFGEHEFRVISAETFAKKDAA